MKLKKVLPLLCLASLLSFVACKSAPEPESPPPKPTVEQPTATPEPEPTPAPEPAKPDFSNANSQNLEDTESARTKAEEAGAKKYFVEKFDSLDKEFENLKNEMQANPDADYSQRLKDLTAKYNALAQAARARAMKEKIDEMDLSSYDKTSYDNGCNALNDFDAMGETASGSEMLNKANEAFDAFSTVFSKAIKVLCEAERKAALEAKKNADSVKAGVSQKEAYKNAADTFKSGDTHYVTQNPESAYHCYSMAKVLFTELFEKVSEARKGAQAAIDRAKARVKEAEEYSAEADEIAPLGEGEVEGIEAEDAKLLEEDNFEAAEASEIKLEEEPSLEVQPAPATEENTPSENDDGGLKIEFHMGPKTGGAQ